MAKHNRIVALCLAAVLVVIMALSTPVCASAPAPDLTRKCSVTFTMIWDGVTIAGGSLRMYRIATWTQQNGVYGFEWVPELADAGLNLSERDTETFARHVSMLVESLSLPAISQPIDGNGKAYFYDLPCGLYVVYQTEPAPGYQPINAYCISLPMLLMENTLVYDIQAVPKPRPEKPTTTAPEPTPNEPESPENYPPQDNPPGENPPGENPPGENPPGENPPGENPPGENSTEQTPVSTDDRPTDALPQTGQLWWPTWVLAAAGVLMLGTGLVMRGLYRRTAEETDE